MDLMKKLLVVGIAAAAFCGAPALAADLPTKPAPVPVSVAPAPVFNWTGFYIGGTAGEGDGNSQICFAPGSCTDKIIMSGFVGGATAGFNWQLTNWVFGVEGDWSWGKNKGFSQGNVVFNCNNGCETDINSFGTLRGRIGYAFDRVLPYLTAGVAFSHAHTCWSVGPPCDSEGTTSNSTFAWGAGVEIAFASQWSAKFEYINAGHPKDNFFDTNNACIAGAGCFTHGNRYDVVRFGLNYKFGGDPWGKSPVVAKY
jgi:outer membrane immunogenic protein